eukprot:COSAG02_NODE_1905_length_10437_cov_54.532643_2_plen_287_part_00
MRDTPRYHCGTPWHTAVVVHCSVPTCARAFHLHTTVSLVSIASKLTLYRPSRASFTTTVPTKRCSTPTSSIRPTRRGALPLHPSCGHGSILRPSFDVVLRTEFRPESLNPSSSSSSSSYSIGFRELPLRSISSSNEGASAVGGRWTYETCVHTPREVDPCSAQASQTEAFSQCCVRARTDGVPVLGLLSSIFLAAFTVSSTNFRAGKSSTSSPYLHMGIKPASSLQVARVQVSGWLQTKLVMQRTGRSFFLPRGSVRSQQCSVVAIRLNVNKTCRWQSQHYEIYYG